MIKLTFLIKEEERGVCIYAQTQKINSVESEEKKFELLTTALAETLVKEANRLEKLGRGKSIYPNYEQ